MRRMNDNDKENGGAWATSVMTQLQRKSSCQLARLINSRNVLRRVEQRLEHHAIFKSGTKMLLSARKSRIDLNKFAKFLEEFLKRFIFLHCGFLKALSDFLNPFGILI